MYLIDGYNLLYQTTLETREELIEKINAYCRHNHKTAMVVFDGYSPEDLSSDVVEIRFVGDADREISDILDANNNPTELVLVSSDKELGYVARKNKIKVIQVEHFNYIIPAAMPELEKPEVYLSESEAKQQLEEFNNFQK